MTKSAVPQWMRDVAEMVDRDDCFTETVEQLNRRADKAEADSYEFLNQCRKLLAEQRLVRKALGKLPLAKLNELGLRESYEAVGGRIAPANKGRS